ncbi:MAG: type II secretion system secretin GspD [Pseudomonadota bacterium]
MKLLSRLGRAVVLSVTIGAAVPAMAQQRGDTFVINLRSSDVGILAEQVSEITGRTLVLDPGLTGEVTVVSAEPLDEAGVWALFQSILRVRGFVAVESGVVWQVVPEGEARTRSASDGDVPGSQDVVTRLVRLNRLPSEEAVRVLRPLVDEAGYLEALSDPNAIVVSDTLENVERIVEIARTFDEDRSDRSEVIRFAFADAGTVANAIAEVLGAGGTGARLSVDPGSNVLLVRGNQRDIEEIRSLAQSMDIAPPRTPAETLSTTIFNLQFANAETVAEIVRGTLTGAVDLTNPVAESVGAEGEDVSPRFQETDRSTNIPEVSIQASAQTNSIIARGTQRQLGEVGQLVKALDVRRPQVMIEAAIVEVSGDAAERLGVQLGFGAATPPSNLSATSFSNGGPSVQSILLALGEANAAALSTGLSIGLASEGDFGILIQALAQSTSANLLSTPSVTTLDNEAATIVVGQNVPFRTGTLTSDGGNVTEVIEREDVGITMDVRPRITAGGVVELEIAQEVSSLSNTAVAGAADIITNRRVINTIVLADDGGTVVLGGLITDDRLNSEQKVPVLGDVPVVGNLFRSRSNTGTKRTLFVFLRPTIMRNASDMRAASEQRFNRLRRAEQAPEARSLLREQKVRKLPLEIEGLY